MQLSGPRWLSAEWGRREHRPLGRSGAEGAERLADGHSRMGLIFAFRAPRPPPLRPSSARPRLPHLDGGGDEGARIGLVFAFRAPRPPPLRRSIRSAASPHLDGGGDEGSRGWASSSRFGLPGRPLCDRTPSGRVSPTLTVGETKERAVTRSSRVEAKDARRAPMHGGGEGGRGGDVGEAKSAASGSLPSNTPRHRVLSPGLGARRGRTTCA